MERGREGGRKVSPMPSESARREGEVEIRARTGAKPTGKRRDIEKGEVAPMDIHISRAPPRLGFQ
jgi:hypothetical protein